MKALWLLLVALASAAAAQQCGLDVANAWGPLASGAGGVSLTVLNRTTSTPPPFVQPGAQYLGFIKERKKEKREREKKKKSDQQSKEVEEDEHQVS